jgi:ATP citrate (pro-S)-lyase
MSAKACREYHGKQLLAKCVKEVSSADGATPIEVDSRAALVTADTNYDELVVEKAWLVDGSTTLVVKPDQLIKRRGKAGLVGVNLSFDQVKEWIKERMQKDVTIESVTGALEYFIVEPFVPHKDEEEHYVCIVSNRTGEEILFYHGGGVDVGDVDSKASRLQIDINAVSDEAEICKSLLQQIPEAKQPALARFISCLFNVYRMLNFTYMEINPLVMTAEGGIFPLDLAAKIDETASFLCATKWGHIDFPAPFGRKVSSAVRC